MLRSASKLNKNFDDAPTVDRYLPSIISRIACTTHNANVGTHCYEFPAAEGNGWHYGICNARALAAGMNGKIHPTSLDRSLTTRARA